MANQMAVPSQAVTLNGDGVSTELRFSINDFPFIDRPKSTPVGVATTQVPTVQNPAISNVASVALQGTEVVVTLVQPFTGPSNGQIGFVLLYVI